MTKKVNIITGISGSGKSTFLKKLVDSFLSNNKQVKGVISIGVWSDGVKVAIDSYLLPGKKKYNLAKINDNINNNNNMKWTFNKNSIKAINEYFLTIDKNEIMIIDEIGNLELKNNDGFVQALNILKSGDFNEAFVSVRPSLLMELISILPTDIKLNIVNLDDNKK